MEASTKHPEEASEQACLTLVRQARREVRRAEEQRREQEREQNQCSANRTFLPRTWSCTSISVMWKSRKSVGEIGLWMDSRDTLISIHNSGEKKQKKTTFCEIFKDTLAV